MTGGNRLSQRANAVDVEAEFLDTEGFTVAEKKIDNCSALSRRGAWAMAGLAGKVRVDGALVGMRVENEPGEMLEVVVAFDQFPPEPGKQIRVRWRGLLPVVDGFDDTAPHEPLPDAVGNHLREAFIVRRRDGRGKTVAGTVGIGGERAGHFSSQNLAKGQAGATSAPGSSVTSMSGLRPVS